MIKVYQQYESLILFISIALTFIFYFKAIERDAKNSQYHDNNQGEDYYP